METSEGSLCKTDKFPFPWFRIKKYQLCSKQMNFDNNVCWHSPQPPRQAPMMMVANYDTSCRSCRVCFFSECDQDSQNTSLFIHNLPPPMFLRGWCGVRTRSKTSASSAQTQVELSYTGCQSSAPGVRTLCTGFRVQ